MKASFTSIKEHGYPLWVTLLAIFVFSMLAIILLVTFTSKENQDQQIHEALEASNKIFAALAVSSLEPVISEDVAGLETIINQILLQVPEIHAIEVFNENQLTLIKLGRSQAVPSENTKTFTQKISYEGDFFGEITISWDTGPQLQSIKNNALKYWLSICIPLFVLTFIIVVSLHFVILKPVSEIRNKILAIQNGDLTTHSKITGTREIRILQNTVNNLCQILKGEQQKQEEILLAKKQADNELLRRQQIEKEQTKLQAELLQAQKMESIGILAGGIAHEFNNILSVILGNNELILLKVPEFGALNEHSEKINSAALRAKDIVKQLLTFSRQDSTVKTLINPKLIVADAINLIGVTIPANIEFKHDLQPDIYPILGNATQIHQLLINLTKNAADASAKSGGEVTVTLSNISLKKGNQATHQAVPPGNYVKLTVQDNGSGIDKQIQRNIFDPFFTTKEIGKGSGIGLAIVHGVVKGHGGSIAIDSQPDKGTTFVILIPAQDGIVEEKDNESQKILPGKERILLVDDEPSLCESCMHHLSRLGYQVEAFTDPEKALARCKDHPIVPDLIISDMAMPKMTGEKLAGEILKIHSNIPIILCTGYSASISKEKAHEMGIKAFLMKPIEISELTKTVRKLLKEVES